MRAPTAGVVAVGQQREQDGSGQGSEGDDRQDIVVDYSSKFVGFLSFSAAIVIGRRS